MISPSVRNKMRWSWSLILLKFRQINVLAICVSEFEFNVVQTAGIKKEGVDELLQSETSATDTPNWAMSLERWWVISWLMIGEDEWWSGPGLKRTLNLSAVWWNSRNGKQRTRRGSCSIPRRKDAYFDGDLTKLEAFLHAQASDSEFQAPAQTFRSPHCYVRTSTTLSSYEQH